MPVWMSRRAGHPCVTSSRSNAAKKSTHSSTRDVDRTSLSLQGSRSDEWQRRSAMECDIAARPHSVIRRCTLVLVLLLFLQLDNDVKQMQKLEAEARLEALLSCFRRKDPIF